MAQSFDPARYAVLIDEDDMPENGLFFEKPYPPDDIVRTLNTIAMQIQA